MSDFWKKPFTRQLSHYLFYYLLVAFLYLVIVSLVSFFHFSLDHRLGMVEEWIFDRGWQIVIISKVLALAVIFVFINMREIPRNSIKEILQEGMFFGSMKEVLVVVAFMFIMIVFLERPQWVDFPDISLSKVAQGFLGSILFYLLDVWLLCLLQLSHPLGKRLGWPGILLFAAIFLFSSKGIFLFAEGPNFAVFCHMTFCLYLFGETKFNWLLPAAYVLLFAAPLSSLLGMDVVWGDAFSVFKATGKVGALEMGVLSCVGLFYLSFKNFREGDKMFQN